LYDAINQHQTVNIHQISKNWSEQIAYDCFLENENVTISELFATTLVGVFEFGIVFRTENIQIFIALFAGLKNKKTGGNSCFAGFLYQMVAGSGFEPLTFGL
jgi:hypothetical protein